MEFRNFSEAKKHLLAKKKETENAGALDNTTTESPAIDPVIFKYFFDLQSAIEKSGAANGAGMDYHLYAREMWNKLVGDITPETQAIFDQFESALISGLHNIDMTEHTYEHVTSSLTLLVDKYQNSVSHVSLWSTGDVESTAYQVGKILKSKIVQLYHKALKSVLSKEEVAEVIKHKTSFSVADNKFLDLTDHVKKQLEKGSSEKIKVVIIEDSVDNFDKAKKTLAASLGENYSRIEIYPIWVTYSREGVQLKKKAETSSEAANKLASHIKDFNTVNDFSELLDSDRFGDMFKDAHLFVDFDGVIGNNITMRNAQGGATYKAFMESAKKATGMNEEDLVNSIKKKIESLN
jgi:hypothetical protein